MKSTGSRAIGEGLLHVIRGSVDSEESANQEDDSISQSPYWLADARTRVRRATRIVDPGNAPGDIIPKGGYYLKIKYYLLHSSGSLKYREAPMPDACVDFKNIVTCPRLY